MGLPARLVPLAGVAALTLACSVGSPSATGNLEAAREPTLGFGGDRKVTRSGDITVVVDEADAAAREVEARVKAAGGYVEHSTATRDENVWLVCRVPSAQLDSLMDGVAALGKEKSRSTSAADVTEQYADLETRLRNGQALRDRLRQLLERAKEVKDVLSIETELSRVQTEVESLQGQLDRLKSQIELSTLSVTLEQRHIRGPLGAAFYGVYWAISKLFVLR